MIIMYSRQPTHFPASLIAFINILPGFLLYCKTSNPWTITIRLSTLVNSKVSRSKLVRVRHNVTLSLRPVLVLGLKSGLYTIAHA